MKDVKRTVLWVLVGFCMISVLAGVFNLIAFLQMVTNNISSLSTAGDKEEIFFTASTIAAILCAIISIAFVFVAIMKLLNNSGSEKSKFIFGLLIAALAICVLFIAYSFLTLTILKAGNDVFEVVYNDYLNYSAFVHYQSYLSAALSTFIPLFIAAALVLGNVVCRMKFQNPETAEPADAENQQ